MPQEFGKGSMIIFCRVALYSTEKYCITNVRIEKKKNKSYHPFYENFCSYRKPS